MKERIVIVFIAVALGLFVTTIGFLLYQQTKVLPKGTGVNPGVIKQQDDKNKLYLTVEQPANESLTDKRTVIIAGKTNPENTITASTNQEDIVATPSKDGSFSISITIDTGSNKLVTRAISPTGEEKSDVRVITYSQEDF